LANQSSLYDFITIPVSDWYGFPSDCYGSSNKVSIYSLHSLSGSIIAIGSSISLFGNWIRYSIKSILIDLFSFVFLVTLYNCLFSHSIFSLQTVVYWYGSVHLSLSCIWFGIVWILIILFLVVQRSPLSHNPLIRQSILSWKQMCLHICSIWLLINLWIDDSILLILYKSIIIIMMNAYMI